MAIMHTGDDAETRAVRQRILVRALEEFSENGLQTAKVERIARQARVSTATLYRLYPGKEGLFAASLTHGLDNLTAWQTPSAEDPLVELVLTARAYAEAMETPAVRKLARILFGEMRPKAPALMELGRMTRSVLEGKFERPLALCGIAGLIDVSQPNRIAALLLGTIEHQCLFHGLLLGDDDHAMFRGADVADHAIGAVLALYGAPGVVFPHEAVKRETLEAA